MVLQFQKVRIILFALTHLLTLSGKAQVSVDIDKAKQFQTIDGFGGFEQNIGTLEPVYVDRIINDLGVTIVRNLIPADIEPANENDDPFNTDLTKFKFDHVESDYCKGGGGPFSARVAALKSLKVEADAKGEPLKIILSCWSPPAWMKYNRCVSGTNPDTNRLITSEQEALYAEALGHPTSELVKDRKDEAAEFFYAAVKYMQEQGVEPYALSIQNELAFGEPYPACVYDPKVYPKVLAAVGKRFRDNGMKTKFFFPEDIGDLGRFAGYMNKVMLDLEAIKYADIGAVHAYATDGIQAGSTDASVWDGMYRLVNKKKPTPFWETETSGYGTDYEAAMKIGKAMFIGLKYGKVSAWLFWGLSHGNPTEGLMGGDQLPTSRYYVAKNYYRYIRPGAISIAALSSDSTVLSLAFQHNENKTLSVILINSDLTNTKTVSLNFADKNNAPATFKRYLTSSSHNCSLEGTVGLNSISLPPNSVTTLFGEGSEPVVTAIEKDEEWNKTIEIFPNPAKGEIQIKRSSVWFNHISISDIFGKNQVDQVIDQSDNTININTSTLDKGIYIITIHSPEKIFRKKLIIE